MHTYEVNLSWLSNRKGELSSPVLNHTIEVATPPEFPKGMPGIWSPEHLFMSAVSSCLMTTFLSVAENSKLNFSKFSCQAIGQLDKVNGKFMVSEITLKPVVVINNADQKERALRVLAMSEKACVISNSITSQIVFEPTITILES